MHLGDTFASLRRLERVADRLGHPFPATLRELYRQFAWKQEITVAFDVLVPARDLKVRRGVLFFWRFDDSTEWFIQ